MAPNQTSSTQSFQATHPRQKVKTAEVQKFLGTGKRTIQEVAAKFSVTPATARKHILVLANQKLVKKTGTKPQPEGKRGRPADLYATA